MPQGKAPYTASNWMKDSKFHEHTTKDLRKKK